MRTDNITFFSVRGRGMNADLSVVKDGLQELNPDITFQYYLKSEVSTNDIITKKYREARRQFTSNVHDAICMDGSYPLKFFNNHKEDKRIAILSIYDYLFQAYEEHEKGETKTKRKAFSSCTHIIPGSPFALKVLNTAYDLKDAKIIDDIPLPISWSIADQNKQKEIRNKMNKQFPGLEGKKVLALLVAGEKKDEEENPFSDFRLKDLVELIRDNYYVITNSHDIMECAEQLSFQDSHSFGIINKRCPATEVLYIADILVTNHCCFGTKMAAVKKPVYYVDYYENAFGRYMKRNYPGMCLGHINNILDIDFGQVKLTEDQAVFCEEFSYSVERNPIQEIYHIFQ